MGWGGRGGGGWGDGGELQPCRPRAPWEEAGAFLGGRGDTEKGRTALRHPGTQSRSFSRAVKDRMGAVGEFNEERKYNELP